MNREASVPVVVIGGIDTHKDIHVAAVVDDHGTVLGTEQYSTTRAGHRALLRWLRSFGDLARVGVEGTGSDGAGIARHLTAAGVQVLEISRPDRSDRRLRGKSDTLDAVNAALAALQGKRTAVPKARNGSVEALRVLRLTRAGAVKARRVALQLIQSHAVSAPDEVRDQVRNLSRMQRIRTCAAGRVDPDAYDDPVVATRLALKSLARRIIELNDEIGSLDAPIERLVRGINPRLTKALGVGTEIAGQILVTAGDNPDRMTSEAAVPDAAQHQPHPRT